MESEKEQKWNNCRYAWDKSVAIDDLSGCTHSELMKIYPVINSKVYPETDDDPEMEWLPPEPFSYAKIGLNVHWACRHCSYHEPE